LCSWNHISLLKVLTNHIRCYYNCNYSFI
jgi:hypothetical protein